MPANINVGVNTSKGHNPAAYRVNEITLTNHSGRVIDISAIVPDFAITESLYRQFLMLEMSIGDDVNLLEEYQLSGHETIFISVSRWEFDPDEYPENSELKEITVNHTFIVTEYPVFAKSQNTRVQGYKIRGVSPHAFLAKFKKVSRSYSDNAINVVKNILTEDLGYDPQKIYISDAGSRSLSMVIPYMDPLEAINWVLRRSFDQNSAPVYCYETLFYKMVIESHSDLVGQENAPHRSFREGKFFAYPSEEGSLEYYRQLLSRIIRIGSELKMSKLTAGAMGAYSSTTDYVDIARKTYTSDIFDYDQMFGEMVWFEAGKTLSTEFRPERSLNEYYESRINQIPLNTLAFSEDGSKSNYHDSATGNALNKAISYLENSDTMTHDLQVYGDLTLTSGMTVELNMSKAVSPSLRVDGDKAKSGAERDEFLSGKYLVTGIKHNFSSEYYCEIRVKRDTYTYDLSEF
jgi:hypothetical protein